MSCTLVTAFYPIKSKFNKDKYLEWGKIFMKLEASIIFFTEEELIPELKKLRENRPIQFITIPFEELDTWKLYKDKWIENHSRDPEKSYHTPQLYAIWAQKVFFVEKAININVFNTKYFFWCDFGAFRNTNIDNIILNSFPSTKYFQDDKLLIQSIEDLKASDKIKNIDGISCLNSMEVRLVGGLWGGSIKACLNWKNEYQSMLERYFNLGKFAGKDQTVMLSTYLNNPQLAIIVKYTKFDIDKWFFLEYLLSNLNLEFEMNDTYNII